MSLREQSAEINRLIAAFAAEAAKFHDIQLSALFFTQSRPKANRKFSSPNHAVMLWQYYGRIRADREIQGLLTNIKESDFQWGLRGAELSSFAVIEGAACALFVRMAKRAGSLFDSMRQRNYRVDRGGSLDYRRAAAQAVGVSSASR